jgi:hypothetical protein
MEPNPTVGSMAHVIVYLDKRYRIYLRILHERARATQFYRDNLTTAFQGTGHTIRAITRDGVTVDSKFYPYLRD